MNYIYYACWKLTVFDKKQIRVVIPNSWTEDSTCTDVHVHDGTTLDILGDPGAVSQVGRKGAMKVFKYGRKSPWVPTLTELFPKIQAHAGSWLGTKNALYYCAQSANSFSWVLFVSSYTTAIVLPHLPGSFTKLVRARETFIFYFPNQKRRNYWWVKKTLGMLSAGAIQFAPRIFCSWLITMYRK